MLRQPNKRFAFFSGSSHPKRSKKRAPEVCQKHDRRGGPEKGKHDQMSNQNRAGQKPKSKGGGLQAKQPSPATDVICREVKVVTVREEPLVGWEFCSAPCHIFALWRKEIMRSAWYHENKEHLVC